MTGPARRTETPRTTVFLRDGTPLVVEVVEDPGIGRPLPTPSRYLLSCANCGHDFETGARAAPYCSLRCHDVAKAVRDTRGRLRRDPHAFRDGVPYECRIKIAHALVGGYQSARRAIPPPVRGAVKARDRERCMLCGALGTEIDHINGDSNEAVNLRLLCAPHHREITEQRLRPITDPATKHEYDAILHRALRTRPERPCDAERWDWRAWSLENRRALH
ncbi:HNH endonuclease [Geodermatophilus ruber]|uniref:HNH endonuclease n=1 Tax=Geodermatophilus ruber TaxID=504800 RepID=UPI0015A5B080|nr:HNH endonuclease signature motif containing protein [Geodermatophilus ruber]